MEFHTGPYRPTAVLALSAALALAVSACSGSDTTDSPAASESSTTVDPFSSEIDTIVGVQYRNSSSAPFIAAEDTGIAAGYGLTLKPEWAESSASVITQLVGGDAQVGSASLWGVVNAAQQGIELRVIGELLRDVEGSQELQALPGSGISDLADLVGKKVGVVGLNSGHDLRIRYLMEEEGLDWQSVEFVDLPIGEQAAALETGAVDAASMVGPTVTLTKKNLGTTTVLDYNTGVFAGFPTIQWIATADFVKNNPNAVAAFQCAVVIDGAELVENDEEAWRAALTSPNGTAWDDATVDATTKQSYPAVNDAGFMQIVPQLMASAGVTPEEFDIASITVPLPDTCE